MDSQIRYYDIDQIFRECVDRQDYSTKPQGTSREKVTPLAPLSPKLPTHWYGILSKVSPIFKFLEWTSDQIDLGRAVSVNNFGVIGFKSIKDKSKMIRIQLNEHFLAQYDLNLQDESSMNAGFAGPSTKPNFAQIAKLAGVDKATVQKSLASVFACIGELLSDDSNIEVDLGHFGKFGAMKRIVSFSPLNRQQMVQNHGKQTVKGLMDLNKDGKIQKHGQLQPLVGGTPYREGTEKGIGYGTQQIHEGGLSGSFRMIHESPTRRFKKPIGEGKIINSLLGAGDDPLAREQDFSRLAANPKDLMTTKFVKPGKAKTRFPPVIDCFSRTLAAPITSQRHYLSVCHRIGTNYTPTSKGFYIDIEHRMIKYKDVFNKDRKLNIVPDNAVEPATEQEEYDGLMNPNLKDEYKIQARKNSFIRYQNYIDKEIPLEVIAPIRQYWINHILELIPADLHAIEPDTVTELVDSMLYEMNEGYYDAVKKAILDYILLDEHEMRRLGIQ